MVKYPKYKKTFLLITVIYDVGQLLIFKYLDFFIDNFNNILSLDISYFNLVMPIGISFFTFQTLSYVIDIYNGRYEPAKNILDFSTYVCLFPQLIAGPIVRYETVREELVKRKTTYSSFSNGVKRFVIGLSKKVLIANVIGEFLQCLTTRTILSSWLKPIGFTLQIYFDFSGYSDMAIGLGLMFGFHFLENFNYPLISKSITEFWRRWHISLSSWFRDYIYIPLGGSRTTKIKWIRNILIVWLLTGFWHGASWNFIIWGLYFGILLLIEKLFIKKYIDKFNILGHVYTIILVVISFLIFNTTSINEIIISLKDMFLINKIPFNDTVTMYYFKNYFVLLILSIIASTPIFRNIINKVRNTRFKIVIDILEPIIYLILIILCTAFLIDESFNPFLYFRF